VCESVLSGSPRAILKDRGMDTNPLVPFLKWPGGKRWLASRLAARIRPNLSGTYFEPFLGGGAVFFHVRPAKAVLSDVNPELIATYRAIRSDARAVLRILRTHSVDSQTYYAIRQTKPTLQVEQAARMLYLNRTAFSGMYRLNRRGEFNVPYGGGERNPAILLNTDILRSASQALRCASLRVADFEQVIDQSHAGDVVYCDPTYTVAHDNNGFIRYNERNFSWSDQVRLSKAACLAAGRGAMVFISNANHESIKRLYRGARIEVISRMSTVPPMHENRRSVLELLICIAPATE
jgi:DNA adenine methylase